MPETAESIDGLYIDQYGRKCWSDGRMDELIEEFWRDERVWWAAGADAREAHMDGRVYWP